MAQVILAQGAVYSSRDAKNAPHRNEPAMLSRSVAILLNRAASRHLLPVTTCFAEVTVLLNTNRPVEVFLISNAICERTMEPTMKRYALLIHMFVVSSTLATFPQFVDAQSQQTPQRLVGSESSFPINTNAAAKVTVQGVPPRRLIPSAQTQQAAITVPCPSAAAKPSSPKLRIAVVQARPKDRPADCEISDYYTILPPVHTVKPRPCNDHDPLESAGQTPAKETDEEESEIFDPSVVMPGVDTTTDHWLKGCINVVESEAPNEDLGPYGPKIDATKEPIVPIIVEPLPLRVTLKAPLAGSCRTSLPLTFSGRSEDWNSVGAWSARCPLDCSLPFCGRDVILVHGYRTGPLADFYSGEPAAQTTWPSNPSEFLAGGYWLEGAKEYWQQYVLKKLAPEYTSKSTTRMPRVLPIAYATTQRLDVAWQAMISQITEAIDNNTNVYTVVGDGSGGLVPIDPLNNTQPNTPFCFTGCVIVSHSTGGPVANVAMAKASADPSLSVIPTSYIRAHVAIEPAFSGSHHATLLIKTSQAAGLGCYAFSSAFEWVSDASLANAVCERIFFETPNTITRDLMPSVMYSYWHGVMQHSPTKTLIVATAHPTSLWGLMWNELLFPGFNDNTVTMDSQLGRPWFYQSPHSNAMQVMHRRFVIDRGNGGRWPFFTSSMKAFGYYLDQMSPLSSSSSSASAAANPYLTPTGMQLPVKQLGNIKLLQSDNLNNTYTFLQASATHFFREQFGINETWLGFQQWEPQDCGQNAGPVSYDYHKTGFGSHQRSVNEESRAVFDSSVYNLGIDGVPLVSTTMQNAVEGTTVTRYFGKKKWKKIKWQRSYYRLKGWQCLDYLDYIHMYAVRQ